MEKARFFFNGIAKLYSFTILVFHAFFPHFREQVGFPFERETKKIYNPTSIYIRLVKDFGFTNEPKL